MLRGDTARRVPNDPPGIEGERVVVASGNAAKINDSLATSMASGT